MLGNGEFLDRLVIAGIEVALWKDQVRAVGAARELLARFAVADTLHPS
jgi:hypothetical protein